MGSNKEPDSVESEAETIPEMADADGESVGAREFGDLGAEAAAEAVSEDIQIELRELEELRDRHLRLAAEFENFRKRTRREQVELRTAAQAELVRRLLPTLDDLARVSSIPHESTTVEALDAGVELILRNLKKELEESGLTRIEAVGEPFDPEVHEGILIAHVDDPAADDTVARVLVEGYEFAGRLVRPAQVEINRFEATTSAADDGAPPDDSDAETPKG